MRKYRKNAMTSNRASMKKHIAGTRRRAKFVGTLYLLATIALAAAACLPLLGHDLAPVGVMEFYKTFLNVDIKTTEGIIKLANSALYTLLLLALVINVFKAFSKLGWLTKKSGNSTYGFNRNVYALDDLGRIFSGSLAAIINVYLLIAVLCGKLAINKMMIIVAGGGIVLHLLLAFWGAKISYYDYEDGEIVEEKRAVGRFASAFRNVLQIASVAAVIYFFNFLTVNESIVALLGDNGIKNLLDDINGLIIFAAQIVIVLSLLVLIKHATATTEFSYEGVYASGMKNFRIFSFINFLAAAAIVVVKYVLMKEAKLDMDAIIIAGVSLVMFIIEIIMRNMPRHSEDKAEKKAMKKAKKTNKKENKEKNDNGEFSFETIIHVQRVQQSKRTAVQYYKA